MRRKGFEASFWAGFLNALHGSSQRRPMERPSDLDHVAGSGIRPRGSHLSLGYFDFDPQTFQTLTIDLILKRKLSPVFWGFA